MTSGTPKRSPKHTALFVICYCSFGAGWIMEVRARTTLAAFKAVPLPGGYPNMLARSDADPATKSFGCNAERLIKAKRHYDPDNVFRSGIPLPVGRNSGRARAASGQGAAAPPSSVMNSRRFITRSPRRRVRVASGLCRLPRGQPNDGF